MNIIIASIDNSEKVKIGGKHIHQELISDGLVKHKHNVKKLYFPGASIYKRIYRKILSKIGFIDTFDIYKLIVNNDIIKWFKREMAKIEKKNKIDIIISQDPLTTYAIGEYYKNKISPPMYMTLHGYFTNEIINYNNFPAKRLIEMKKFGEKIEQSALNYVNGIVTVDSRIKKYIIEELNYKGPVEVLYNAIDTERFVCINIIEKTKIRAKLNMPKEKKIILVARRLVKKNGVNYALDAIKYIKNNNILLVILGDGPEEERLKEQCKRLDIQEKVIFKGAISHDVVDKYYKCSDILLMPSTKIDDIEEATSLSMLEGMACGLPVIASAIGGMKEVIKNGINGILVDDKSPEQIAKWIDKLLNNNQLYNNISKNAYEYCRKYHSYLIHAQKYLGLCENMGKK